jgi:hypothetical protein
LEVAGLVFLFAGKRNLWALFAKQRCNLLVRDIADLVVVVHNFSVLVAYTAFSFLHESVTGFVVGTDIAINASPALVAFAC